MIFDELEIKCKDCNGKGHTCNVEAEKKLLEWFDKAFQLVITGGYIIDFAKFKREAEEKVGSMPENPITSICETCSGIGWVPTTEGIKVLKFIKKYEYVMYKYAE